MIRLFGHYVSKIYLLLGLLEFLIFFYSLPAGLYLRFIFQPALFPEPSGKFWVTAMLYAVLLSGSMTAVGVYQRGLTVSAGFLVRLGLSFLMTSMGLSLFFYAFPKLFLGRGVVGIAMLVSIFGIMVTRSAYFRLAGSDARDHRVLVLGAGRNASMIHELEGEDIRFRVLGYVNFDEAQALVPRDRCVELKEPLLTHVVRHEVDEIVIAQDDRRKCLPVDQVLDCKMSGIKVLDLLTFFEQQTSRINTDILYPSWVFFSNGFERGGIADYVKRLLDIVGSLLILVAGMPLLLGSVLAILIESRGRGPVLFHQTRVGRNGRHFQVYKFRSMRADAEADGVARWAEKNDSRITPVGAFLRKTRLDEMPQVFNVLRGDMSLVGPRPERPEFVEELARKLPFYHERHRVKPGLTGWAQLCYPYGSTTDDARMKLQYDLYYVKNASFFLDLIVLLETVEVVLWGKGAQ